MTCGCALDKGVWAGASFKNVKFIYTGGMENSSKLGTVMCLPKEAC